MFVERLSKEELEEFAKRDKYVEEGRIVRNSYDENQVRYFEVCDGRVTFSIGRVDFLFTDFDCSNNYVFRSYNGSHNKDWLAFMFEKFGMEYKLAFYKYRTMEKRRLLKQLSDRIDSDNARYEKIFEEEKEIEV